MIDMHIAGPAWVGVRGEPARGWPCVRRVWAHEEDSPHRRGVGLGARIGSRTFMVGFIIKRHVPFVRELHDSVYNLSKTGEWNGTAAEEDALNT